jgi:Na+-translocating ferredoxin:NAD+ oxidoreductase subunit D
MKLVASSSPHLRTPETIQSIMFDVLTALFPVALAGVILFGYSALITILLGTFTAMATEALVMKEKNIVGDGSAAVTGLLLALTLPPAPPWWMVVFGSVVAILIGKHVFGGLGNNLFNPALVGRAVLTVSWPGHMTNWLAPGVDAVSAATPLAGGNASLAGLFVGTISGSIGETSALALILGALWLLYRGHISWHIPVTYIATVFVMGGIYAGANFAGPLEMVSAGMFQVLAGGLLLGALYMATDMVTSPVTREGQILFGIGLGLITMSIRFYGGYPEGVTFAILLMNGATPLLDNLTIPKRFGEVKS